MSGSRMAVQSFRETVDRRGVARTAGGRRTGAVHSRRSRRRLFARDCSGGSIAVESERGRQIVGCARRSRVSRSLPPRYPQVAVEPLAKVVAALTERNVRFVLIGVAGANYYAESAGAIFATEDRDLFLPSDADNLVRCWAACATVGLELFSDREPLDQPHDRWLAERVVARRALTRAMGEELRIDLSLVMKGFDFETVWAERRVFVVDGVDVPVARLRHIVESKHVAGRDKDRLFLATHREALEALLRKEG